MRWGSDLTMLQDLFGVRRVDGVYWTLWIEMQFYLLMLGLLIWGVTTRRVLALAASVPASMVAVALLAPSVSNVVGFLGWSPLFGAGMALYVIYREGSSLGRWAVVGLNAALSALMSGMRTAHAIDVIATGGPVSPQVLAAIAVLAVAAVAAVALVPWLRDLDWRVLTFLGALTYPLYLIHEYFGWAMIETLNPRLGVWATLFVVVAACLLLAWLLHRLAERPFHRRFRDLLQRTLERRPGPARVPTGDRETSPART